MEKKNGRNEGYYKILRRTINIIQKSPNKFIEDIISDNVLSEIYSTSLETRLSWILGLERHYLLTIPIYSCYCLDEAIDKVLLEAMCVDIGNEVGCDIYAEDIL